MALGELTSFLVADMMMSSLRMIFGGFEDAPPPVLIDLEIELFSILEDPPPLL